LPPGVEPARLGRNGVQSAWCPVGQEVVDALYGVYYASHVHLYEDPVSESSFNPQPPILGETIKIGDTPDPGRDESLRPLKLSNPFYVECQTEPYWRRNALTLGCQ
jgi:hypothetical protein